MTRYAASSSLASDLPAAAQRLELVLQRFVDAAMAGDDEAALSAFVEAQAAGVGDVRVEAQLWAERERVLVEQVPESAGLQRAERLLSEARRGAA